MSQGEARDSGGGGERRRARAEWMPRTWAQWLGVVLGLAVAAGVGLGDSPLHHLPGHEHRPAYAAAVAALMAIWWFTEALPITWTALLPLVLFPALGVFGAGPLGDLGRAASSYVDAYIFLFLGGMAIGAAMEESRLHRRVALAILDAIGTRPERLLLGMLVATAAVSLWISNTATAVMMLPIAVALCSALEASLGGRRLESFGGALLLAVAYAANVGGIGTKIGTATNSIFAGFLAEKLGYDLGFARYLAIGLPFVVLFIPLVWAMLWREARRDGLGDRLGSEAAREVLERERRALGRMSSAERRVAVVFGVAALLWIAGDPLRRALAPWVAEASGGFRLQTKHYEAGVALAAALGLGLLGALPFRALRRVPWGTLLLLGGSFAMAAGIEGSGLGQFLASELRGLGALPFGLQLLITSLATVALSAVASNTATINVMLNVLPRSLPLLTAASIAASCDFALPAGTPPNAIVFASGYIRLPTMMRIGIVLDLGAALLLTLYGWLYLQHVVP